MADSLGTLKDPLANTPMEPGDLAHHLQNQRPLSEFPCERKFIEVLGSKMAHVDEGDNPIVFIHGAPESAYIWHMPCTMPDAQAKLKK